ncbi:MAG: VWA domain-containing protein [Myxococcales bacterium]|nr:VWA domain-containing protein [Myxococcales bacterium]
MFVGFFLHLRARGIPVTTTEFLSLLEAIEKGLGQNSLRHFYALSRATLVKSEAHFDSFDKAFAEYFQDAEFSWDLPDSLLDWLSDPIAKKMFSPEELAALEKLDLEELHRRFEETLREQKERHDGGGRWVGTGGKSPYGHGGTHPTGVRVGGGGGGRSAVQIAGERRFQNLRNDRILDTRQIGMALRRLRRLKREGSETELDLDASVDETARNAGEIEMVFRPPRDNNVKLLLLMDVGGSMDPYTELCEQIFSAAHQASHFKQFEYYFFHNCVYNTLYKDMIRLSGRPTLEVLQELNPTWRLVFVGDAYMHPYELMESGGAIDYSYHNTQPGIRWLQRFREKVPKSVWLNPEPKRIWDAPTIATIRQVFPMFELTIQGLTDAVDVLRGARSHTPEPVTERQFWPYR